MSARPQRGPVKLEQRPPDRAQIGRYRLAYELASGGMATVYMACVDAPGGFDKVVALKRIHRHLANEERYVEMFLDEARIASRIDHPNVASVMDFGEDDGEYFLVMEFLVGVPLWRVIATLARDEKISKRRWPAIASRLIAEACEGLHAAHELRDARGEELGIVHRDISPQNLFVGFDGVLRVVDFGIAKAAGKLHKTSTGELKGKVAYMSPEQLKGEPIDRRADVWALGVVLWEMISFRRLFRGENEVDSMYAVLERDVPPLSEIVADVPSMLDDLVGSVLTRDRDLRCADARSFSRELTQLWARELDAAVDASVVSELLAELFPGEEARQRQLVELARYPSDDVPRISVNPADESFSGIVSPRTPEHRSEADTKVSRKSPASGGEETSSRPGLIIAGIGLLAALLGAVVVLLAVQTSEELGAAADVGSAASEADDELGAGGASEAASDTASDTASETASETATDTATESDHVTATDTAPAPVTDTAPAPAPASAPATDTATAPAPAPATATDSAPATDTATDTAPDTATDSDTDRAPRPPPQHGRGRRAASAPQPVVRPPDAPPAPPAQPVPAAAGRLAVVVPGGWANVYDETHRFLGVTPLNTSLPSGSHRIELRFYGEPPPVTVTVTIPAGGVGRVSRRAPAR